MEDVPVKTQEEPKEPAINVAAWVKKFEASEKVMRSEFRHKYQLAKARLRAETEVKNKNSKKMTHSSVNLVYSIGTSFKNSVYFKAPNCNLTAREEVQHENVENTEIAVNDWLKDKKVKNVVNRVIWDAYLGGFGARFIDHEYDDIEDPNNILVPGQPEQTDPITGQPLAPATPPEFGRIVLKNEITIQRIRPDLVRFPKGFDFDNYQDSPWIGFEVITPIDEVKGNEKWDQRARQAIEGEKYSNLSDKDSKSSDNEGDDIYAKISYCFIRPASALESFKLVIFCHKYKELPLQVIDFDKGHVGYPVKFLYFNPLDDDCSYPNGDPWNFESQLAAVDTWWRKYGRHVERSNPKTVYDSGSVEKGEVQKLKSNNDEEFVGLKNPQKRSLQELVYEMQRSQVNPDVSKFFEVARQILSEIAPRSGISRGAENEVDTATEAKIINTGEVIDVEARVDEVVDFIKDIILDVAGILEKSMTAPIPIKKPVIDPMTGQPMMGLDSKPETQIISVNKTGFTSKVTVDVEVESMRAQNKDVLFKQLLDFLQILVKLEPIMNKAGKTINPIFWLERIMETRNIRNVEKGIMDLPPAPMMIDPKTGQPLPMPGATPGAPMGPPPMDEGMGQGMEVQEDVMASRV